MSSTRFIQLLLLVMVVVLLVLEQPSSTHTQLGILRKIGGRKMLENVPLQGPEEHQINVQVETLEPNAASKKASSSKTKKNDSKDQFLDAADEVANLMWKDYSGRARPRRKPPIHNYNPTTKH
ncbi:uncharacterized protein LOC107789477 [Nicotiana tabacum]|uniref:Uncharacterized protein LOC107789477 n=2 Tax=Nicotiana TaxID=4085 RepID=A0A1S3ZQZ3_TOBAC|nr:PREDICTED: uncharacterized protein LOC104231748 [Nicotiana sylvestris]XP_016466782.1 PREDICTED: uncharacterized protein LOC107789477 [Nicotiana tabacum]